MDTQAIEGSAVSAVKDFLNLSEYLSVFIAENDKEPSWDGFIYIYDKPGKKKAEMHGRVPLQVKGKKVDRLNFDKTTYPMEVADLRNFRNDGGTILFVVYIWQNPKEPTEIKRKVFFNTLTPITLRHLLNGLKDGQKTKSVEVTVLPETLSETASRILNFYEHCSKQASFANCPLPSLEDLEKDGVLEGLSVPVSGYDLKTDYVGALLNSDAYMYAKVKGIEALMPLDFRMQGIHVRNTVAGPVTVNGKLFYTSYDVVRSIDKTTFIIGDGLRFFIDIETSKAKLNFTAPKMMRALVRDLSFFLACFDNNGFELIGNAMGLNPSTLELKSFDIQTQRKMLSFWQRVVDTFTILHCDADIEINTLTAADCRNLETICDAVLDKKPTSVYKEGLCPLTYLGVGSLRFAMLFLADPKEPHSYIVTDYFSSKIAVSIPTEDGQQLFVPQFVALHTNEFLCVSNMRFDKLLPAFQEFEATPQILAVANIMLLDLIDAYDKATGGRKQQIIEAAVAFADWLMNTSSDAWDKNISILNKYQLTKRERTLNSEEQIVLNSMINGGTTRDDVLVGAYLLLDDFEQAEKHFAKLDTTLQEAFRQYPIYHLWKKQEVENNG